MDYIVKNLHFILIHIPLSMLIFSFIFDLLAWTLNKREWHTAAALCLFAGTLGAVASVLTGPSMPNPAVQKHALYGQLSMALFIVLSLVRLWFIWKKKTAGIPLIWQPHWWAFYSLPTRGIWAGRWCIRRKAPACSGLTGCLHRRAERLPKAAAERSLKPPPAARGSSERQSLRLCPV
ncbi:hypothetical protein SK3146_04056 [Paenibacillus konkukensis]|uniref:DUF2231 domain-containing protein n=1 Tax=Paenibacillus konkukensis TaxID=2020716 RepID=A0ABY4RQL8_9BACL|nr:DUF2231 domain-containing protein [Paenibacillus doosanensis]UQZ84801.1 hypothetical protein SK3146_04056 [Paenibacillus konkukensis]